MFVKLYKVVLAFKYASDLKKGLFNLQSQERSYFAKFALRVTKLVERAHKFRSYSRSYFTVLLFSLCSTRLERFSYDPEKWFREVFVICFISQWMKGSKHGLFVFPPKKTLIWRRYFSIGQSCCSMTSKRRIH